MTFVLSCTYYFGIEEIELSTVYLIPPSLNSVIEDNLQRTTLSSRLERLNCSTFTIQPRLRQRRLVFRSRDALLFLELGLVPSQSCTWKLFAYWGKTLRFRVISFSFVLDERHGVWSFYYYYFWGGGIVSLPSKGRSGHWVVPIQERFCLRPKWMMCVIRMRILSKNYFSLQF